MADFITTVSRKYSQEIQTAEYGFGLEGVLRARGNTLTGILNAVDYASWNPETDRFIAAHYSADGSSAARRLQGAICCRSSAVATTRNCRSSASSRALRQQKGFDLIQQVADRLAHGRVDPGRAGQRRARVRRHVPPPEQTVSAEDSR